MVVLGVVEGRRFGELGGDLAAATGRGERLREAGFGEITTEIAPLGAFYYAEDYHQQYLAKNPGGYCGIGGTGVSCPVGLGRAEALKP